MKAGAAGVELDVRRCKSSELVVIHDPTLKRTVYGNGRVSQTTLAEIKKLHIRGGGTVPTLEEVFGTLGKNAYCFIELKTPEAAVSVARLIETYAQKGWRYDRLILISFRHKALQRALKACPEIHIGASFKQLTPASIRKALKMGAQYVLPHYKSVSRRLIERAHKKGLKIGVWTVNSPRDVERMRVLGADAIMTDYPEKFTT